jgi:prepilin-type N-terminal cleavage/methylation domain-containing protein
MTGHRRCAGFSLVELLVVVAVACILMGMTLPAINRTMTAMHLGSASSSLTGALQAARYQAISIGCPVSITVATGTYQLATLLTPGSPPTCSTSTWVALPAPAPSGAVPYAGADITLNTTQVLQFNPSGTVTASTGPPQVFTLVLSNGSATRTITVSGVGNVKVQ